MTKQTKKLIKKASKKDTFKWTWKDELEVIGWMNIIFYTLVTMLVIAMNVATIMILL